MTEDDKVRYRELLLERRAALTGDVSGLENEAKTADGEVRMPTHLADVATNAEALEENLSQIEVMGDELRAIDAGLARLDNGTYGQCTGCGQSISHGRLEALPFAELCITCKQAQENGQ